MCMYVYIYTHVLNHVIIPWYARNIIWFPWSPCQDPVPDPLAEEEAFYQAGEFAEGEDNLVKTSVVMRDDHDISRYN